MRETDLALRRRLFGLALHWPRHLRLQPRRAHGRWIVEVERIFEFAVVFDDDGPGELRGFDRVCFRGRPQGKRVGCFLLRQLLGGFAEVGFRHLADLEPAGASYFAHDWSGCRQRRVVIARYETQGRSIALRSTVEMLADDGRFHLLLAPAFGESSPLQREGPAQAEHLAMKGYKDRGQADAGRQEQPDQHRRDQHDGRADAVQIRRGCAIELLTEITAGWDQGPAQPDFPEGQITERRRGDDEDDEADGLGLQVLDLFGAEAVPANDQERARKQD
jgi:hypothetical protein